ncbi:MAG: winged helix-turn-helix domain-containing protein [Bryobacterales bacterium]
MRVGSPVAPSGGLVRFGPYAANLDTGELFKGDARIHIQDQPFRVLAALLDQPGALISHEELVQQIWSDGTHVEFERALRNSIAKLRAVLHDSADHPLYVETVPRRGYRFVAPVQLDTPEEPTTAKAEPVGAEPRPPIEGELRRIVRHRNVLFGLLLLGAPALFLLARTTTGEAPSDPQVRLSFQPHSLHALSHGRAAISPDGRTVAYVSGGVEASIWARDLDSDQPHEVKGTAGASRPFWSADGRYIGFASGGFVRKAPREGGFAKALFEIPEKGVFGGASWLPDGERLAVCSNTGGLRIVSEATGAFETLDAEGCVHPSPISVDGKLRAIVYNRWPAPGREVRVWDVETGTSKSIVYGSHPKYASNGRLVYQGHPYGGRGLWALPFSAETLEATGEPVLVSASGMEPSLSANGTLTFIEEDSLETLRWRTRKGKLLGAVGQPHRRIEGVQLSPDGSVAVARAIGPGLPTLWLHDMDRATAVRITEDSQNVEAPAWIPGRDALAYLISGPGERAVVTAAPSPYSESKPIVPGLAYPWDASDDGRHLLYGVSVGGSRDIYTTCLDAAEADCGPRTFVATPSDEITAVFSPSGRYVAYASNLTGRYEIYVRRFPQGDGLFRVSPNGGIQPRWSRNGKEIFFVEGDSLVACSFHDESAPAVGSPEPLLRVSERVVDMPDSFRYDVSADGARVLVVEDLEEGESGSARAPRIKVILNWQPGD